MSSLFLVRDEDGTELWVAWEDQVAGHLYVYVANTEQFHRNDPLAVDFYYDRSKSYEPIDPDTAAAKIAAGVGRINERHFGWLVEKYRADPNPLSVSSVLGAQVPVPRSPQARSRAFATDLTKARPGVWVTYKTYPTTDRQKAHVAAYDLRAGKIRSIAEIGPIDTRVIDTDTAVEVQVARQKHRLTGTRRRAAG